LSEERESTAKTKKKREKRKKKGKSWAKLKRGQMEMKQRRITLIELSGQTI